MSLRIRSNRDFGTILTYKKIMDVLIQKPLRTFQSNPRSYTEVRDIKSYRSSRTRINISERSYQNTDFGILISGYSYQNAYISKLTSEYLYQNTYIKILISNTYIKGWTRITNSGQEVNQNTYIIIHISEYLYQNTYIKGWTRITNSGQEVN